MKKVLAIILVLLSAKSFAQTDGNYNYSAGVRIFNLFQLPKILQQSNSDDFLQAVANGGIIRVNDNQISYRLSGSYFAKNDFEFKNICDDCETAKGNVKDFSIRIGFEKNFNYSVIQPYFGVDLGYKTSSFTGDINPSAGAMPYAAKSEKWGGTLTPLLGFKINVAKQISLFAEGSLDFYYLYERQETILNDPAKTRSFKKYNKLEMLFNPVSAGVQFHFIGSN